MSLLAFCGAETGSIDAAGHDGERIIDAGGNVSIIAGALQGQGAYRYRCDLSVSAALGAMTTVERLAGGGAGRTTAQFGCWCQYHQVTTPVADVWLMRNGYANVSSGNGQLFDAYAIRYNKLTDGKLHVYVQGTAITAAASGGVGSTTFTTGAAHGYLVGDTVYLYNVVDGSGVLTYDGTYTITAVPTTTTFTVAVAFTVTVTGACGIEVNPAAAFIPAEDTPIGLILEMDYTAPYGVRLYYATGVGGATVVLKQSGNAHQAPGGTNLVMGVQLSKSVNWNCTVDYDNCWIQDNGGTNANTDTLGHAAPWWDVVIDGKPNALGFHNDWANTAGTNCAVGGANCYVDVSDGPPPGLTTYDQLVVAGATGQTFAQSWKTSALKVVAGNTVGTVIPTCWSVISNFGSTGTGTFDLLVRTAAGELTQGRAGVASGWYYGGTFVETDNGDTGTPWTPASAQAAEIGVQEFFGNGTINARAVDAYKIVVFRAGAAPPPPASAHSQVVWT